MPYKNRTCIECKKVYLPTSSSQKACAKCGPILRAKANVVNLRNLRAKQGATTINTIKQCLDCGDDFVYRSGPQVRCKECKRTKSTAKIREWFAKNPDLHAKYIKQAKDNYAFSGNRAKALERDGFACCHCRTQSDLCVHHIDGNGTTSPRESRNNSLDNLMTLCRSCHTRVHHSN